MATEDNSLRNRITSAVCEALQPLPNVLAGWEGGSIAFDATDEFSDIDLNFLVDDTISVDALHAASEFAIAAVSPITATHSEPPGRYYKLKDGGEFLLVDLCFFRAGAPDYSFDVERHGQIRALFDKGEWLSSGPSAQASLAAARAKRQNEHDVWFLASQNFVQKAIIRGHHADALAAFWAYTLRPLVELLRMRHCSARWDFGMRYLDRDLPLSVYEDLRDLMFVKDPADLAQHLERASAWGERLLQEFKSIRDVAAAG
jgi:hypothetical protein